MFYLPSFQKLPYTLIDLMASFLCVDINKTKQTKSTKK